MVTVGQQVYNSLILLVYKYLSANIPVSQNIYTHPDEGLNIEEQISRHGYQLEEHILHTSDGYILSLFRVLPSGKENGNSSNETQNAPILFVHGFFSSAYDFLVAGPNLSIAYKMIDSGYDVWLGNCRGNTWSRKHVKHRPEDPKFWQFSFHEIGYYDLPAKLDYITKATGYESVYYVGHSQGTTSMMVMASERSAYIKKVRLFIALAPVAFPKAMPSVFVQLGAFFYKYIEWICYTFEYFDFLPHDELLTDIFRLLTRSETPYTGLFHTLLFSTFGYSNDTNLKLLPLFVGNFPAGGSTRQGLHFLQNKVSDSFRKYDYGITKNIKTYGQLQPPKYNLRTKMPTALIYSNNDWLSTEDDVARISAELKNLKLKYRLPGAYGHMDYLLGQQATQLVTNIIKKLVNEY